MHSVTNFKGVSTDAMQMLESVRGELSARQYDAVLGYLSGLSKSDAVVRAGYHAQAATEVFRSSKVQAALARIMDRFLLGELAPLAMRTAYQIMADEKGPAGVRATLAVAILDRAGFSPKRFEKASDLDQDIGAMSREQIQQALAKLDRELTSRMVDVTPDSEPMTSQELDTYS